MAENVFGEDAIRFLGEHPQAPLARGPIHASTLAYSAVREDGWGLRVIYTPWGSELRPTVMQVVCPYCGHALDLNQLMRRIQHRGRCPKRPSGGKRRHSSDLMNEVGGLLRKR